MSGDPLIILDLLNTRQAETAILNLTWHHHVNQVICAHIAGRKETGRSTTLLRVAMDEL